MYKEDLALNNRQWLIYHETNPSQAKLLHLTQVNLGVIAKKECVTLPKVAGKEPYGLVSYSEHSYPSVEICSKHILQTKSTALSYQTNSIKKRKRFEIAYSIGFISRQKLSDNWISKSDAVFQTFFWFQLTNSNNAVLHTTQNTKQEDSLPELPFSGGCLISLLPRLIWQGYETNGKSHAYLADEWKYFPIKFGI